VTAAPSTLPVGRLLLHRALATIVYALLAGLLNAISMLIAAALVMRQLWPRLLPGIDVDLGPLAPLGTAFAGKYRGDILETDGRRHQRSRVDGAAGQ
jgi:hypothetical protein